MTKTPVQAKPAQEGLGRIRRTKERSRRLKRPASKEIPVALSLDSQLPLVLLEMFSDLDFMDFAYVCLCWVVLMTSTIFGWILGMFVKMIQSHLSRCHRCS